MESTFIFIGRLFPRELCDNLNIWPPLDLGDNLSCIAVKDGLAVEFVGEYETPDVLHERVRELVERLLDSHSFFLGYALQISWNNWIEAQKVLSHDNLVGWIDPSLKIKPHVVGHPDNQPFFSAQRLLAHMEKHSALRIALRDFRTALSEPGKDAIFYAFRALEAVRWHFQEEDSDKGRQKAWSKMHSSLDTSEGDFQSLTADAVIARHGTPSQFARTRDEHIATIQATITKFLRYLGALPEPKFDFDNELVERVRAAFGSRPDLPPGEEYVREIRKIWAGLLKRGENG